MRLNPASAILIGFGILCLLAGVSAFVDGEELAALIALGLAVVTISYGVKAGQKSDDS